MKNMLMKVVSSPAVRKALLVLVAAVASTLGYSQFGCQDGRLSPKVAKQLDIFACQVDTIQAVIPSLSVAEEVVIAFRAGNLQYAVGLMTNMGANMQEIIAGVEAFEVCGTGDSPMADAGLQTIQG